jgi:hypothetical protein
MRQRRAEEKGMAEEREKGERRQGERGKRGKGITK